jgi:transcriptional regulator with XRE-family HTH domain
MQERSFLGNKLFEIQCDKRLSGKEMADLLGISSSKLSRLKRAKFSPGSITINSIAIKLDLPVSYFIEK